jgi:hypothetical protein
MAGIKLGQPGCCCGGGGVGGGGCVPRCTSIVVNYYYFNFDPATSTGEWAGPASVTLDYVAAASQYEASGTFLGFNRCGIRFVMTLPCESYDPIANQVAIDWLSDTCTLTFNQVDPRQLYCGGNSVPALDRFPVELPCDPALFYWSTATDQGPNLILFIDGPCGGNFTGGSGGGAASPAEFSAMPTSPNPFAGTS